jgi:hypothetical protein
MIPSKFSGILIVFKFEEMWSLLIITFQMADVSSAGKMNGDATKEPTASSLKHFIFCPIQEATIPLSIGKRRLASIVEYVNGIKE